LATHCPWISHRRPPRESLHDGFTTTGYGACRSTWHPGV
jgi:hypothetical protein